MKMPTRAMFGLLGFLFAAQPAVSEEGKLYWAYDLYMKRSSLDGSDVEVLLEPTRFGRITSMAFDDTTGKVYWLDLSPGHGGFRSLRRADQNGSNEEILATIPYYSTNMALDTTNGTIYVPAPAANGGGIERFNLDGTRRDSVAGGSGVTDVALDVAGGKVYWTTESLYRANLDGTGQEALLATNWGSSSIDLDLANGKIYWHHVATNEFGRANLDGSAPESLFSEAGSVLEFRIDPAGGKIYWTNQDSHQVVRANVDGTAREVVLSFPGVTTQACGPSLQVTEGLDLDLANGKLRVGVNVLTYSEHHSIWQANLDGTGLEVLLPYPNPAVCKMRGVALDESAGKIYWTEQFGSILRANFDGTNPEKILSGLDFYPGDIVVDPRSGKFYWVRGQTILRADADGSNLAVVADRITLPSMVLPGGITLDLVNDKLYWADSHAANPVTGVNSGVLHRSNLDGTELETIAPPGIFRPVSVAVDPGAGKLYWGHNNSRGFPAISRANFDGTEVQGLGGYVFNRPISDIAIDVADGYVYWAAGIHARIGRRKLDGTGGGYLHGEHGAEAHSIAVPVTSLAAMPVANPGPDQNVNEGDTVTLDGSASTGDGDPLTSFAWIQVGGPPVDLDMTDPIRPTFVAPVVASGGETLTFELVVGDGTDYSIAAFVDITIANINNAPVADAGDPQTAPENTEVTLNAGNSFDPDGDPLTCSWMQTAGTAVDLADAAACTTTFVTPPLVPVSGEILTFSLTVVDDSLEASTPDTVNIEVTHVNQPPIADAGGPGPILADEFSTVTLDGTGSTDPEDGIPASFQWVQTGGPAVVINNADMSLATFVVPPVMPGGQDFTFLLTVGDGEYLVDEQVIIRGRNINDPPDCTIATASAGELWPPNHKYHAISIENLADPDANEITVVIDSIFQDEPVNGLGDGDTAPDAVIVYDSMTDSALVRSERSGIDDGRVYHIGFTASDGFESCSGEVLVTVPHDRKHGPAQDGGPLYNSILDQE